MRYATEEFLAALDKKADEMREKIRNSKTDVTYTGTAYYVAADGDDNADGLTPDTAWKTLAKVTNAKLNPGDAVFFKRGDLFRGNMIAKERVTYSAYGEGEKPKLYGSPFNMADESKWILTDTKDVYMYDAELCQDIGAIVFNDGDDGCARKVMKLRNDDGTALNLETREPFNSYRDLVHDLDFWHAYRDGEEKRVYLCSKKCNPAKRFKSIEFSPKGNLIGARNGAHIDNLCLKYCGSHGVGSGTNEGLTITNCEFGWIGGSIQGESIFGRKHPTRFGNAVEIYGGCKHYSVTDSYFYQVYDAAITHQVNCGREKTFNMEDVLYKGNLIETSSYSIEYFLSAVGDTPSIMDGLLIEDNFCRFAGYGWGDQRPDKDTPAHIKGWNSDSPSKDYVIRNNIFDRGRYNILQAGCMKPEYAAKLEGNTYIQYEGNLLGNLGDTTVYNFDENVEHVIKDIYGDKTAEIYFVKKD